MTGVSERASRRVNEGSEVIISESTYQYSGYFVIEHLSLTSSNVLVKASCECGYHQEEFHDPSDTVTLLMYNELRSSTHLSPVMKMEVDGLETRRGR